MSKVDFSKLRKRCIGNILATDMQFHFKKLKKFKDYNESKEKVPTFEVSEIMIHLADLSSPANS